MSTPACFHQVRAPRDLPDSTERTLPVVKAKAACGDGPQGQKLPAARDTVALLVYGPGVDALQLQ